MWSLWSGVRSSDPGIGEKGEYRKERRKAGKIEETETGKVRERGWRGQMWIHEWLVT